MKERFHGYYRPTDEEFEALWKDAIIVLDANVLLNQYSYSHETREEFLRLLSEMGERVWLPYQAAAEFHQNRCGIILKEVKRYREIIGTLQSAVRDLQATKHHPFIDISLLAQFKALSLEIEKSLIAGEESHKSLLRGDPLRDTLTDIYAGRTGEPLSKEELDMIYAEGETRFANKIPTGYEDRKKQEPDKFGDLVIWKEIISISRKADKGVIFVTDDAKEDWWLITGEERIGPRPELVQEFRAETGNNIYVYSSDQFAKYAKEHGKRVSEQAYAELEAANAAREHNELEQRLVMSKPLTEFEAQQGELAERLRGPLAGYEAQQRDNAERFGGLLAGYEAQKRELAERLRGPLAGYEAQQRENAERFGGLLAGYEAQKRELAERLRGPLAGYEAQQRENAERLRGALAGYEAQQRENAERFGGLLGGYEAQQREVAERLRGPLAGIQPLQPELGGASKNLSDVDKADKYDKKKLVSEGSGSEDLRVGRVPDDHPKTDDD
jgi:predicted nucleic acid-binding protein